MSTSAAHLDDGQVAERDDGSHRDNDGDRDGAAVGVGDGLKLRQRDEAQNVVESHRSHEELARRAIHKAWGRQPMGRFGLRRHPWHGEGSGSGSGSGSPGIAHLWGPGQTW